QFGIAIGGGTNNTLLNNTANYNGWSGIVIWITHNNTIEENTASFNNESGISLFESNNNTVNNNIGSFNNNTFSGIYLNESHGNTITWNTANNNYFGICINYSNYNYFKGNILQGNTNSSIYEAPNCEGNVFVQVDDGPGDGGPEPPEDNLMFIIIIIIIIGMVAAVGTLLVVKQKSKPTKASKEKLPIEQETEIVKPIVPVKPKKSKKIKKDAVPSALTEEEKREAVKTEAEMGIEKQQFVCIVHKGPIVGANVYICPGCQAIYCTKCATALKDKGEHCWSCEKGFEL
ncbi:MAG: NosD domain-containing protein, partial [Candidatus Kariarchaeaceae archaeon]